MCSCSLACMKELARCSMMQWRAGPAAAEPAAEKRKQGLAKPRRPNRLAAMLPPDRAAWSTPPPSLHRYPILADHGARCGE